MVQALPMDCWQWVGYRPGWGGSVIRTHWTCLSSVRVEGVVAVRLLGDMRARLLLVVGMLSARVVVRAIVQMKAADRGLSCRIVNR